MIDDWFYTMDVFDASGKSLGPKRLYSQLASIVQDSERRKRMQDLIPVGILTSDERDTWALVSVITMDTLCHSFTLAHQNRQHLLSLSNKNASTLRAIESSVFALALDTHTLSPHVVAGPSSRHVSEIDFHLHNARSGHGARNRWLDKPYTLVVESNTRTSVTGEHSPCDALIPSIVAEYALTEEIDPSVFGGAEQLEADVLASATASGSENVTTSWRRLDWVADDHIRDECLRVQEQTQALIADSDNSVLWFDQ